MKTEKEILTKIEFGLKLAEKMKKESMEQEDIDKFDATIQVLSELKKWCLE